MNYSRQRNLIQEYVKNVKCHPTAEDVYKALKPENSGLSLGTVYRNLKLLSENGTILKLTVPNSSDRYDGQTHEHQHMNCIKCANIYDIELHLGEEIKNKVLEKTGFVCLGYNIIIKGTCKGCINL